INPQFAEGYFNLFGIHAHLKKDEEAWSYLEEAIRLYREQNRLIEATDALKTAQHYLQFRDLPSQILTSQKNSN
ncbi:MAG: hypothetical protein NUV91_06585, partial [Candidatus Omnitrophica bacterium]|nr:hypothetical protein [Candidatus Omnitrophota bacterium]